MPINVSVDARRQLVEVTVIGDVDAGQAIDAVEAVVAAAELRPGFRILSDHRRIGATLSPEQVHRFAAVLEQHRALLAGVRWAAVVARATSYGVMRALAARTELVADMQTRVFTGMEEARAWLEVPEE